jgi:hypothetical protein
MTQRERLPSRRRNESFDFEWRNMRFIATTGRFPDGRLAEVFISNGKINTDADTSARDSAVVCSIALQFGADLATIRGALLRDARGVASGPLGIALDTIAAMEARQ